MLVPALISGRRCQSRIFPLHLWWPRIQGQIVGPSWLLKWHVVFYQSQQGQLGWWVDDCSPLEINELNFWLNSADCVGCFVCNFTGELQLFAWPGVLVVLWGVMLEGVQACWRWIYGNSFSVTVDALNDSNCWNGVFMSPLAIISFHVIPPTWGVGMHSTSSHKKSTRFAVSKYYHIVLDCVAVGCLFTNIIQNLPTTWEDCLNPTHCLHPSFSLRKHHSQQGSINCQAGRCSTQKMYYIVGGE